MKFKSQGTSYKVTATYFDPSAFELKQYEFESDSKNELYLKRYVVEHTTAPNSKAVQLASVEPVKTVNAFEVKASLAEIKEACIKAGLTVVDIASDSDNSESENADIADASEDSNN